MKQVLQNLRDGKTEVVEVPVPKPGPGMALVHTGASLVSAGTERMVVEFAEKSLVGKARSRPDLVRQVLDKARREGILTTVEAAFNRLDQPMPLGYSSAGTIVELGAEMVSFQVGQRVACAGGNYAVHAEYAVVPKNLLAPLPDNVDFEQGAFATLGSISLHGFRLAEPQLGERVAVIGLGLLGLLAVGIAKAAGCQVFGVDLDPQRVQLAQQMGAEAVLREGAEEAAQTFSGGQGCDVVLICADTSSNDPVELAASLARDRARVVAVGAVGLELPRRGYFEKELTFLVSRSYGPGRYDTEYEESGRDYPIGYVRWTEGRNLESFVELLGTGNLDVSPLISHRFPIEDAPQAYELITGKQNSEAFLGVVLTYPEASETSPARVIKTESEKRKGTGNVWLGVLGAGNFAQAVLLPALKGVKGVELVGIASASGLSAQHAAKKHGFTYAASDAQGIIADEMVNTIAVLTRHNLHAEQVIEALQAGKNVFCEKPLALNEDELAEIKAELDKPDAPLLMVGFNRRFAPLAIKLKAFLSQTKEPLAMHYRVNAGYLPLDHWLHDPQQGGGRIIGEGCHFVDFLTYLAGAPPVSVSATALSDGGRYRQDNVVLTFEFPDGSVGTLSYLANGDKSVAKERVEVFAGGRVALLDDFRALETTRNGRSRKQQSRLRQDKGHRAEWQAFAKAIAEGGAPPIAYEDLLGVTRATFAAMEALRVGEKVPIH
ncbi:MAG: hypothetical protein DWQ07_24335 [Chloroflexi bacterium]|nr:MAG: hypothetical protein DWQ07_24335 [Chloroflexota bacterium]MBL1196263.1 hypothetical protein [Chloroflexota bacterium]NOH13558.1 Gfo/Idh/MocA family oxidoreductase [Chloroflexota bacterium]